MKAKLYIIKNEWFPENTYKIGYTERSIEKLKNRYNTYYGEDIKICKIVEVNDGKLAEKLLFHKLKKYRYKKNREFFEGDLDKFKKTMDKVQYIINNKKIDINEINNYNDDEVNENEEIEEKKEIINNKIKEEYENIEKTKKIEKMRIEIEKNKKIDEIKKRNIDKIKEFIENRCDIDERNEIRSSELYDEFIKWNQGKEINKNIFTPILETLGYYKI